MHRPHSFAPVAAPAPEPPPRRVTRRRRSLRPILAVVLILVAFAAAAALFGLSRSHFVGAERNGHVAVYQGVPWDLVGSVRLYRLRYESPLLVAQLSQKERKRLCDPRLQSYDSALRDVRAYEADIAP